MSIICRRAPIRYRASSSIHNSISLDSFCYLNSSTSTWHHGCPSLLHGRTRFLFFHIRAIQHTRYIHIQRTHSVIQAWSFAACVAKNNRMREHASLSRKLHMMVCARAQAGPKQDQ